MVSELSAFDLRNQSCDKKEFELETPGTDYQ